MAMTTLRTVLQTAALSTLLATPFVRGAHAAGKLSVGFWDHWVPGANVPLGSWLKLENVTRDMLGTARKVRIEKETTSISAQNIRQQE